MRQRRASIPSRLKDIRVEGLQRTTRHRLRLVALPHRRHLQRRKGAAALRAVRHGPVQDVQASTSTAAPSWSSLTSGPVIANDLFVGLKEFDNEALTKSLKDVGIGEAALRQGPGRPRRAELKRQYLTRSLYGAEVTTTITPIERNRVNVSFSVTEGRAGPHQDIRIVGNKVFSESTLLGPSSRPPRAG